MVIKEKTEESGWLRILKLSVIPILLAAGFLLIFLGYDWRVLLSEQGSSGFYIYFLFVTLLPLIGFPISAFYIFSGMAFSPITALLLTSGGLLLNMILGYWIGRFFLHQPITHYLKKTRFNPEWLDSRNLLRMTILVRSVPGVPYFMQNYILGLSKVPFWIYLFVSWSIQTLYCAGTIFLTNSGMNLNDPTSIAIFLIVGILFFSLIWYSKKKLYPKKPSGVDLNPS